MHLFYCLLTIMHLFAHPNISIITILLCAKNIIILLNKNIVISFIRVFHDYKNYTVIFTVIFSLCRF